VEAFEKVGTSFVAVTQSFNTTNSMGRLTLNMLLSFAQFEREVTAERIRDKLAASKAKGMWMGGIPPLGYKPDGRSLVIVEPHAQIIRDIYARYSKLKNVRLVYDQLLAQGVVTPPRKLATGKKLGGAAFSRSQIHAILKNPIYAGNIGHRGQVHPGNHEAIIPPAEWDKVQQQLGSNLKGGRGPKSAQRSLLAGKVVDEAGAPLIATHASKQGKRYRYYVSKALHFGERSGPGAGMRIPAGEIETAVADMVAAAFDDPLALAERCKLRVEPAKLHAYTSQCALIAEQLRAEEHTGLSKLLQQVEVRASGLKVTLPTRTISDLLQVGRAPLAPEVIDVSKEMELTRSGRAVRFVQGNGALAIATCADPVLVQLVMRAQSWWSILRKGEIGPTELARQEGVALTYITRVVRIAFLAPQVLEAVLTGRLKAGVTARMLYKPDGIPSDWDAQIERFVAAGA
jgi:hypothetical protein